MIAPVQNSSNHRLVRAQIPMCQGYEKLRGYSYIETFQLKNVLKKNWCLDVKGFVREFSSHKSVISHNVTIY